MKTADIIRAYRNRTTHAAALAAWQTRRPAAMLHTIRELPQYAGKTLAERRAYAMRNRVNTAPELSAPESETPYLWTCGTCPLVLDYWPGRRFLRRHGWFTDDYQEETLEAYAVRLVDFPRLVFAAVKNSMSEGLRVHLDDWREIDFATDRHATDAARDAIHAADSIAEREAEEAREFYRQEARKQEIEDARAELAENRREVRGLIAELRKLCPTDLPATFPAAAAAVKAELARLMRERSHTLQTIAQD